MGLFTKVWCEWAVFFICVMKISTLEILNPEDQGALLSDDEIFSSRQTAKHTCMALRRYFEAHLGIKVEQVKQSLQRTEGGVAIHPQPYYKVRLSFDTVLSVNCCFLIIYSVTLQFNTFSVCITVAEVLILKSSS